MKDAQFAAVPILIGPANALAVTGHSWRYVREVLAALPGVRVVRSGDRIVGVIASDVERHAGQRVDAAPLNTTETVETEPTPSAPETVDAVLAVLGRRRRIA